MHDLAVHGERLHLPVSEMQNRPARGFVNAAAFHADKTVLDHIDPAHAVFAAEGVERFHHAERIEFRAVHGDAVAFLEIEFEVFRLIRGILG